MPVDPMDLIASLLCKPNVWVWFAGLLLFTFFWGLKDLLKVNKIIKQIEDATRVLPFSDNYSASDKAQRALQKEFFDNFDANNRVIASNQCLGPVWTEFVESTIQENDERVILVTQRPAEYFYRDSVTPKTLHLTQLFAFPNYLIGLGLVFTFVGIAAALHVAQGGLSNADGGHKAMQDLLAVASTKFISSLVGIFLSLCFGFILKWKIKQLQHAIDDFCHRIEAGTQHKPIAHFLHLSHKESVLQTQALTDMAMNIANGVTSALANQLPASVAAALEPLAQEIRGLATKFSGSNEGALQNVLDEFLTQMRGSTAKDMDDLVSSIGTLKGSLEILTTRMSSLSENFGSETKASTARLSDSMESFSSAFAPVEQGMRHFGDTLGSLEGIAARIETAGGNFGGAADANNASVTKLSERMAEMSEQVVPLQQALVVSMEVLSKMAETAIQLQSAAGKISSASDEFKLSATEINNAESQFSSKVQTFASVAGGISDTVQTLGEASTRVSAAAEPLDAVSKEVGEMLRQVKESERRLIENQAEMNSLLLELKKYSEILPSLWQQYEGRFLDVDSDLANAFGQLSNGSKTFQASVETYVKDIDDKFSHSLDKLSGVIREFTEERESSLVVPEVVAH